MMSPMKPTRKYHFSVEGETEDWYLGWLQDQINNVPEARYRVSMNSKVQKNPVKRAKSMNIVLTRIEITHLIDCESNEDVHTTQFQRTLDLLKDASNQGRQIRYSLGYSNYTFELWMVLHKANCNTLLTHRGQYLDPINKAYDENFNSLDEYKHEDNFKRVLRKISLPDVKTAIDRSRIIMQRNEENGLIMQQYKGYSYYKENPSLSVWESVERILRDCRLLELM